MEQQPISKFQQWYAANKHLLALRRKRRYRLDPEYRAKRLAYWRKHQKHAQVLQNRRKKWKTAHNGKRYKAFDISEAKVLVGKSRDAIRWWEKKGIIPCAIFPMTRRHYTMNQISMMRELMCIFWRAKAKHLNNPKVKDALAVHQLQMFTHWYD
jgi:hypothetical protein